MCLEEVPDDRLLFHIHINTQILTMCILISSKVNKFSRNIFFYAACILFLLQCIIDITDKDICLNVVLFLNPILNHWPTGWKSKNQCPFIWYLLLQTQFAFNFENVRTLSCMLIPVINIIGLLWSLNLLPEFASLYYQF